MRIARPLCVPARKPQKEPVPFQELLPVRLKNWVSGRSEKDAGVSCLQELSVMFACLKRNEFEQALCSKEIGLFQNCYKQHLDNKFVKKQQEKKGVVITGSKNLGSKQINQLLKRFPQPD
ncbi:small ribosomal subunit protein mS37 [Bacillus rossius redtenbacheri]|uniref:small ribosomal subunit protein mS37 n=1 Tax=Bacillus rossius redtenbacheri TaxID=93214 RepID=UPI002FDD4FBB